MSSATQGKAADVAVSAERSAAPAGLGFTDPQAFADWGLAASESDLSDAAAAISIVLNALEGN
jgi:hypothetical protein